MHMCVGYRERSFSHVHHKVAATQLHDSTTNMSHKHNTTNITAHTQPIN